MSDIQQSAPSVVNNEDESRYEITLEDGIARLDYEWLEGVQILTHTEVPEAHRGQGLGEQLVKHAMEQARTGGYQVTPWCSFAQVYLRRHKEYQELIAE